MNNRFGQYFGQWGVQQCPWAPHAQAIKFDSPITAVRNMHSWHNNHGNLAPNLATRATRADFGQSKKCFSELVSNVKPRVTMEMVKVESHYFLCVDTSSANMVFGVLKRGPLQVRSCANLACCGNYSRNFQDFAQTFVFTCAGLHLMLV